MITKIKDLKYVRADIEGATKTVEKAAEEAAKAKTETELKSVYDKVNNVMSGVETYRALAYIRYTLDVNDMFYRGEQEYYDSVMPALESAFTAYQKAIIASEHNGAVYPLVLAKMRDAVKVMDERIVADCAEENKLVTEYDDLMANMIFPWNGEKLTLGQMQKHTKDKDRAVRKKAFCVIGETLKKHETELDVYFDKLVAVRTRIARKLGYKDYSEMGDMRIGHFGYGRKEIAVFRESVKKDVVPAVTRLKTALARKLGISDGIHIYDNDNYVAGGNIDPVGTAADLFKAAQKMYDDMNKELGAFFRAMTDAEAIDYVAREGKLGGGYAEMLEKFEQPFILANFNGTMDDVGVLTHELGHAYAFMKASKNGIDRNLFVGGMETAETHSMSMEALCNNYNELFYGDRADDATYQQIFDAFNFLCYGVIVDYFQEKVYKKPEMTAKERKELWLELEGEFRPYVDMKDVPYFDIGGRWQYQKHIYECPFYYIDYCLSTCLALQFGEIAAVDKADALSRYLDFVDKGGSKTIDVLAHEAGLMSPFDEGALKALCEKTEKRLNK